MLLEQQSRNKRQKDYLSALVIFCALFPLQSGAQTVEDSIVKQLQIQGYQEFTISRTLLGRLRIVAQQGSAQREIVVNPRTGEVLRDVQIQADDGRAANAPAPDLRQNAPQQGDSAAPPPPPSSPPPPPPDGQTPSQRDGGNGPGGGHG